VLACFFGGYILSYVFKFLLIPVNIALLVFVVLFILDLVSSILRSRYLRAERLIDKTAIIGVKNRVELRIQNKYNESLNLELQDEVPYELRNEEQTLNLKIKAKGQSKKTYYFTPKKRGSYTFNRILIFVPGWFKFLQNRVKVHQAITVNVMPNQKINPKEVINTLQERESAGEKILKTRGQSMEFDQISDYTIGDDPRFINWSATARSGAVKINKYVQEKAHNIYFIIDKGRTMNYEHNQYSLLDYAINASVHLAQVALRQGDRAGTIVFSNKINAVMKAYRSNTTLRKLNNIWGLQSYKAEHSNFTRLYLACKQIITQRSLLFMFTNFDTFKSLQEQIAVFRRLNKQHLLVVVFFKDAELEEFTFTKAENYSEATSKTIARQYYLNQMLIKRELEKYSIKVIHCHPKELGLKVRKMYFNIKKSNSL